MHFLAFCRKPVVLFLCFSIVLSPVFFHSSFRTQANATQAEKPETAAVHAALIQQPKAQFSATLSTLGRNPSSPEDLFVTTQDIYDDFPDTSPSRIRIASQISAHSYTQFYKKDREKVRRLVQQSLEIRNAAGDDEVRRAIPQALEQLSPIYTKKSDLLNFALKSGANAQDFEYIGIYQHTLDLADHILLFCMGGKQLFILLLV